MSKFKNSIRLKILAIPTIAAVSILIAIVVNAIIRDSNSQILNEAETKQFPLLQIAERNLVRLNQLNDTLASAVTTGDTDTVNAARSIADSMKQDLIQSRSIDPAFAPTIAQIESELGDYEKTSFDLTMSMVDGTADFSKLREIVATKNAQFETVEASLTNFRDTELTNFQNAMALARSNSDSAGLYSIIIGLVAVAILFAAAIPISAGILKSVSSVVSSLRDIANEDGDLTVRLTRTSDDEVGELVHWFNTFMDKLQNVITEVIDTVEPLAEMAETLNTFVSDTLRSVDQQKNRAIEIESSAKEITDGVQNVSDNANQAAASAEETAKIAAEGQSSLQATVTSIDQLFTDIGASATTIEELEEITKSVSLVIGVIKNIAEQTNLLALNAAIEAARAGEQGRGFAVVADEVRSLASKTQQSTDEIQQTIIALETGTERAVEMMKSSMIKTQDCVASVNEAGQRFQSIVDKIDNNGVLNIEIAAASSAQNKLSQLLQQNAVDISAGSRESHAATNKLAENIHQLANLSGSLKRIAGQFRVR